MGIASIILALYFLIHLYVFSRLSFFFTWKKNLYFYLTIVLLASSFFSATMLEKKFPNSVTRIFYISSTTWLGFLFLLACCMAAYEIVHLFFATPRFLSGLIILGINTSMTVYSIINASSFRVREVTIPMNVDEEITVVQISDAHLGTVRNSRYLAKIVERTNSLEPDLVAVTGDLFDGTAPLELGTISCLDKLQAPVFFVTGNHENYEGIDNVLELLKKTRVRILRNQAVRCEGIQIIGIDYSNDKKFLEKTLSAVELDKSEPSLLLYHLPVKAETLNKLGIHVQLAGHTHKGQIFPYTLIDRLAYAYLGGLHNYKDSWIYVSEGSGTWGPPMRLGTKSEIALIRLKKNREDSSTKTR